MKKKSERRGPDQKHDQLIAARKTFQDTSKRVVNLLAKMLKTVSCRQMMICGTTGHLYYFYDHHGMISDLVECYRGTIASKASALAEKTGRDVNEVQQALARIVDQQVFQFFKNARSLAEEQVPKVMNEADIEIPCWLSLELCGYSPAETEKVKRDLLQFLNKQTKSAQGFRRAGGRTPKFDLSGLSDHYRELLPKCADAKKLYKSIRNRPKWREMVKVDFPDMDEDLVCQLSYPKGTLSAQLFDKITKQGATSKPSDIALEWAARRCGVSAYYHKIPYLKEKVRKLNR